jgi:hypothetical protein
MVAAAQHGSQKPALIQLWVRVMAAFNGRDFLVTATTLATANDEGSQRSAISRAYYACFHCARDHVRSRSIVVPTDGRAHVAVRREVARFDPTLEWTLLRLHTLRKQADYDVPFPKVDLVDVVPQAIDLAARIVALIDALAAEEE